MANKSKMFTFRISERDYLTIQGKAEKSKLSMTAFITNSALNKNIVIINGLDDTTRELKAIGRNLNQLTTLCNMGKIQSLDLMTTKEQLRQVYTALLDITGR
jgi:hypothetical protein